MSWRSTAGCGGCAACCPRCSRRRVPGCGTSWCPLENVGEAQLVDGVTVHAPRSPARRRRLVRAPPSTATPLPPAPPPGPSASAAADRAGPRRRRRPAGGPARPRARRGRWAPPADGRATRGGQDDARRAAAGAAAARAARRRWRPRDPLGDRAGRRGRRRSIARRRSSRRTTARRWPRRRGRSGVVRPGAISRAHRGVLFLDEAPEFKGTVLQSAAPAARVRARSSSRGARQVVRYPARFQLVLAANPCPCGRGLGQGPGLHVQADGDPARMPGACRGRCSTGSTCRCTCPRCCGRPWATRRGSRASPSPPGWPRRGTPSAPGGPAAVGSPTGSCPGHVLRRPPFRLPGRATAVLDRSSTADGSPCAGTTGSCGCRGRRPTSPAGRCPTVTTSRWGSSLRTGSVAA